MQGPDPAGAIPLIGVTHRLIQSFEDKIAFGRALGVEGNRHRNIVTEVEGGKQVNVLLFGIVEILIRLSDVLKGNSKINEGGMEINGISLPIPAGVQR